MTIDTNYIPDYCEASIPDPDALIPSNETLDAGDHLFPGIIDTMLTCSGAKEPADLAAILGVSEAWLLRDFSNAYELLQMFCYITETELTINRGATV